VLASAVPEGDYLLRLRPTLGSLGAAGGLHVKVTRGPALWGNFILLALLYSLWPAWVLWRHYQFESQRWVNSEYDPYPRSES
jgi:hypothetical protein